MMHDITYNNIDLQIDDDSNVYRGGKLLPPHKDDGRNGNIFVYYSNSSVSVQTLVALAFIGKPPSNNVATHIDRDRTNNHRSNIIYKRKGYHRVKQYTDEEVLRIFTMFANGIVYKVICTEVGGTHQTLSGVINRRTHANVDVPEHLLKAALTRQSRRGRKGHRGGKNFDTFKMAELNGSVAVDMCRAFLNKKKLHKRNSYPIGAMDYVVRNHEQVNLSKSQHKNIEKILCSQEYLGYE